MHRIPFIEIVGVTRTFGRQYALHRLSLTLKAGRINLVLGPNGAGKSTLLAILATLDRPTEGQLRFGEEWDGKQMARQGRGLVGWVAHESLVYGELSGRENLEFYGRLYGLSDPAERSQGLIDRVGLSEAADRPVRTYSRGMRQRLSLARALLNDPAILILDEPFTGLDREGRNLLIALLVEARDAGRLVVLSTHFLDLPTDFVDEVIVLRRGRLRFHGPPEGGLGEFYERVLERKRGRRSAAGTRSRASEDADTKGDEPSASDGERQPDGVPTDTDRSHQPNGAESGPGEVTG